MALQNRSVLLAECFSICTGSLLFTPRKNGILDNLIDFWGPFSWVAKMAFFGLRNGLSGIPGFRVLCGVGTIAMAGVLGERQGIAQKGVHAIDPRKSAARNG